jgi:hypothetical protein
LAVAIRIGQDSEHIGHGEALRTLARTGATHAAIERPDAIQLSAELFPVGIRAGAMLS